MTRELVRGTLREYARDGRSTQADLWPLVRRRLAEVPADRQLPVAVPSDDSPIAPRLRTVPRRRWLPATQLGWAAALVVLLLGVSSAAFALAPLFDKRAPLGVEHLGLAGLGRQVDLQQTVDGYTVSVKWVYADGNRVIVLNQVEPAPADPDTHLTVGYGIELRDSQGTLFPTISGGVQARTDEGWGSMYSMFDAAGVAGAPAALDLRLTLHVERRVQPLRARTPRTLPPTAPPQPYREELTGPLTFEFSVPFIPARVVNPAETISVDGVSVTLEEFRVAPSEARATIGFDRPEEHVALDWRPMMDLKVGSWSPGLDPQEEARNGVTAEGGPAPGGWWRQSWLSIPYENKGPWTITVTELVGHDSELEPQITLPGPWTFEVTLPAASN